MQKYTRLSILLLFFVITILTTEKTIKGEKGNATFPFWGGLESEEDTFSAYKESEYNYDEILPATSDQFRIIVKNGKRGVINESGSLVLPPEYDSVDVIGIKSGLIVVYVDGKQNFVKDYGELLFDEIQQIPGTSFIWVKKNGKKGLAHGDRAEIIIPPEYDDIGLEVCEGDFYKITLDWAEDQDGIFGYIDSDGNRINPFTYLEAGNFEKNGLEKDKTENGYGFNSVDWIDHDKGNDNGVEYRHSEKKVVGCYKQTKDDDQEIDSSGRKNYFTLILLEDHTFLYSRNNYDGVWEQDGENLVFHFSTGDSKKGTWNSQDEIVMEEYGTGGGRGYFTFERIDEDKSIVGTYIHKKHVLSSGEEFAMGDETLSIYSNHTFLYSWNNSSGIWTKDGDNYHFTFSVGEDRVATFDGYAIIMEAFATGKYNDYFIFEKID